MALALSLLTPGLGQLYNGQRGRGIGIYFIAIVLVSIFFAGLYSTLINLTLFSGLGLILVLYAILDASFQANKIKHISSAACHRWHFYIAIIVCHFFLIAASVHMGLWPVKLYQIATSSMAPTLLPGDYFIIDKKYYGSRKPGRGDIVVFQSPVGTSRDFIKRVVGLPGETIEIVDRKVTIDKKFIAEPYLMRSAIGKNVTGPQSELNFGPVTIPENSLFLLGDNREGSNDSRYFGSVQLSEVRGKALFIVWAGDNDRIGTKIH